VAPAASTLVRPSELHRWCFGGTPRSVAEAGGIRRADGVLPSCDPAPLVALASWRLYPFSRRVPVPDRPRPQPELCSPAWSHRHRRERPTRSFPCPSVPTSDGRAPARGPPPGHRRGGIRREAHLPAQHPSSFPPPRLPAPHVGPRWSRRREGAPPQGTEQAVGLIGRISDRSTFDALRRDGRRVRSGPIWIRVLLDDPDAPAPLPPRLACAFGRRTGSAVTRNLVRRRVRATAVERLRRDPASIPPGAYLVGGSPEVGSIPYALMRDHVERCLDQIRDAVS
jgi:ribonuclease P protein component